MGTTQVSVVVIAYNDAEHVAEAVQSALAQGRTVGEVIAVDDASDDATADVLDGLAATDPRVRVLRSPVNSGGCGAPRNDGLRAATQPYVLFLDSDDVLAPGAIDALHSAVLRHGAEVAAGACVRRELPQRRDVRWQAELFLREAVYDSATECPLLLWDTLSVNKLYARDFLLDQGITFPEGAESYEDFVFTARMHAATPRIAVIPDVVYFWHVRRDAARPSISLDRDRIGNWRDRVAAHREVVQVLLDAGQAELAAAARAKFVDYDLRMYLRELPDRAADYRRQWWELARGHLSGFGERDLMAAAEPARWAARVVLASPEPRDVERLSQLSAQPPRLLPPYVQDGTDGPAVWAEDLPQVTLDGIDKPSLAELPVTITAALDVGIRPHCRLRILVHELYGRLAEAGPSTVELELRDRRDGRLGLWREATLNAGGESWTAEVRLDPGELGGDALTVWDVWVRVRCLDGASLFTAARALPTGLGRAALPHHRHLVMLVQPYATTGGSLAIRVAPGVRGVLRVAATRFRRAVSR